MKPWGKTWRDKRRRNSTPCRVICLTGVTAGQTFEGGKDPGSNRRALLKGREELTQNRSDRKRVHESGNGGDVEQAQGAVELADAFLGDVKIDGGGGEVGMTQEMLNGGDLGSALDQMSGEGMS